MRVIFVTASIAIFFLGGVKSEEVDDYHLPPPEAVLVRRGKVLAAPHHHNHHHERPKYIERYVSSELNLFGGHPPPRPLGPPPKRFRLPHPNSLPREPKAPFDIVRAPVIYHQTVTDTDVTRAIADAFDVVEKLRKPGKNKGTSGILTSMPVPSPPTVENQNVVTYEYVNHIAPNQGGPATKTTTTIVDAPHILEFSNKPSVTIENSGEFLTAPVQVQVQQTSFPPIPSAHDLPPLALPVAIATSAPLVKQALVPAVPTASIVTPTTPIAPVVQVQPSPPSSAKLIIPSQSHVTTLAEAVNAPAAGPGDSQVRTIIQPVYIPYPVDQNGQPVGPLPDYHSMDFGAILSAQNQFVVQDAPQPTSETQVLQQSPPQPQQPPQQVLQVVQQEQQRPQLQLVQQLQQQQYQQQVSQDQLTAGDSTSDNSEQQSIAPARVGRIRRRKKGSRRIPARRI